MLLWTDEAWADYVYWQSQDRKTIKKINLFMVFLSCDCQYT